MDPFSLCANIITVLQATYDLISICYDFRAVLKQSPWSLSRALDEAVELRAILERLERLSRKHGVKYSHGSRSFEALCNSDQGPLAGCLHELSLLRKLLDAPKLAGKEGTKRHALVQALGWRLKDADAKACFLRLERYKSSLNLALSADETALLLDIEDTTASIDKTVHSLGIDMRSMVTEMQDERKNGLLRWLCPVDPLENHESALQLHEQGTSRWFLDSKNFEIWKSGDRSLLWLSGLPGAGKTLLFSHIVAHITRQPVSNSTTACAYFYCDFRKKASRDPINVVGSLVAQLCVQTGWFTDELQSAFDTINPAGQRSKPTLDILCEAIELLADRHDVVLLIDALDECDSRSHITKLISRLYASKSGPEILVTSRDELDLRESLQLGGHVRLEEHLQQMDADIRLYTEARLESDTKLSKLPAAAKDMIKQSMGEKSSGMFRWVQCQLDSISGLHTVRAIRVALTELPRGLDETYSNILRNVSPRDATFVRKMLLWLAFSVLPLSLEQVHEAIAIEIGTTNLDEDCRLSNPQDILSLCGSLITISDDESLSLAHLSVKDYLLSANIKDNADVSMYALTANEANEELAATCLTYLSYDEFKSGPCSCADDYASRLRRYPLLKHAATAWPYYVRGCNPSPDLEQRVLRFFNKEQHSIFMSWVQVLNGDYIFKWGMYPAHATPLYYAATFGLDSVVAKLIASGAMLDVPGSRFGGTAVHGATLRKHHAVIQTLLEAGANPNRADWNGVTPLHTASVHGGSDGEDIVKLLLKFGASASLRDEGGETPIDWATKSGQHATQMLLVGAAATTAPDHDSKVPRGPPETAANVTNKRLQVWTRSGGYFPGFYEKRSGVGSSIVVKVETGPRSVLLRSATV